MAKRHGFRRTPGLRTLVGIVTGAILGLVFGMYSQDEEFSCFSPDIPGGPYLDTLRENVDTWISLPHQDVAKEGMDYSDSQTSSHKHVGKELVMIGVMTAAKYLNSRAKASFETWVHTIPGKVLFFSSEGSEKLMPHGFPVIGLKGVDDSYPPQKKSFLMLKYMYEYYGDKYEWFMRVDDDIYVKGDKLAVFLRSVNSTIPQFIGQAGLGNKEEFGMLNINTKEPYCMGGSGMAFSTLTLQKFVPHVSYCLQNLFTTHEDVEVGRCITRFSQATCTWAYEFQQLFYHNHKDPNGSFAQALKTNELHHAITMHPVKNHTYQYRIHTHFKSVVTQTLRHRTILLQRQIHDMDEILQDRDQFYSPNRLGLHPSLLKFIPKSRDEVLTWDFISKNVYTYKSLNPHPVMDASLRGALDDVVRQVMESINQNARQRGRTIDFKDLLYGYKRVDPLHGANYVLDLLLVYRKHKGRKMTIPVRRHAYLHQAFSDLEFREDTGTDTLSKRLESNLENEATPTHFVNVVQQKLERLSLYNQPDDKHYSYVSQIHSQTKYQDKTLNFIMTVSGRYDKFQSFMENFEAVVLKREKRAVLSVMLFKHETEDRSYDMSSFLNQKQHQYPQHKLQIVQVDGPFSRGLGLEKGSLLHSPNALLVFIDVDMYLHSDSLVRIKLNTIQGNQVYFPVVFSQFNPSTYCNATCQSKHMYSTPFHYSDVAGYWRHFGFGIAAMYNSDFQKVGGFDKEIEGWGMEDVKLFETYVKRNFTLFRSAEPGLVHVYHTIDCNPNLESSQYQSCLGTKASTFASIIKLAEIVYNSDYIFHRNEPVLENNIQLNNQGFHQQQNQPREPELLRIPQIRRPGS